MVTKNMANTKTNTTRVIHTLNDSMEINITVTMVTELQSWGMVWVIS